MDFSSYFNYAIRLWKVDKSAAQELREGVTPSIWMSLVFVALFGLIMGIIFKIEEILVQGIRSYTEIIGFFIGSVLGWVTFSLFFYLFIILWSQMWINIYGGDRRFSKTLEIFTYIYIPSFIINIIILLVQLFANIIFSSDWISNFMEFIIILISLILTIYVTFVIVKTFSITHNLGIKNAFKAGLFSTITFVFIGLLILFIIAIIIFSFIDFASLSPQII